MKNALALAAVVTLFPLAACGSAEESDAVTVVAGAYPLAWVAEQVAGPDARVENLTSPGVEPHDIELTARQVGDVQDADLVLYIPHFQEAVDDAVDQAPDGVGLDATRGVDLLEAAEEGEDHEHDHGHTDPHLWLDPTRLSVVAKVVMDRLSEIDPDHADGYQARGAELASQLASLDHEFTDGLRQCERRTIVTSHAAFAYLADRYDLTQVPIAGVDPSAEPAAGQLADISDLVRREGITTIFTEELVSPAIARTVASETGATTAVLDPIEGVAKDAAGADYLSLMRANLAAIRKADACE